MSTGTPPVHVAHYPARLLEDHNPYGRLLYSELARLGVSSSPARLDARALLAGRREVDALHFHWNVEQLYEPPREELRRLRRSPARLRLRLARGLAVMVARLGLARMLGYRLFWTIHEVHPHESASRGADRVAARVLARLCHGLLAHDAATAERAERALGVPASKIRVVPHGSYTGAYARRRPRDVVRAELGVPRDAFAFLVFGHLRHMKEIGRILEAFARAPLPHARLLVAGAVWEPDIRVAVTGAAERDPRILPMLRYVADEDVGDLFGACDAAVVARSDGWTSGSLILALSQGLPVVAARKPAYVALLGGEDAGWLFEPGSAEDLTRALTVAAFDAEAARAKGCAAARRAGELSWAESAEGVAAALAAAGRRGPARRAARALLPAPTHVTAPRAPTAR